MRDVIVTALVGGSLPVILFRPWIGILVWCWISYMNPHRLCWGFAITQPYAAVVAATTLIAMFISAEPKRIPWTRETILLAIFILWMTFTTLFSMNPAEAWPYWEQVMKIQLMTFVTLMLIQTHERLQGLVWAIVVSLGFYGVKGGLFSYLTGGSFRVHGPTGSFIGDNNDLAVALVMTLPLMWYLQLHSERKWIRRGLILAMLLTLLSILGTYSRGGFLALVGMCGFMWLKSRRKLLTATALLVSLPLLISFMPDRFLERMSTITEYKEDGSALGRLNAWQFAWNVATEQPVTGGGFRVFIPELFHKYAPMPDEYHAAHSVYFLILGEHGFVGLFFFLLLGLLAWRTGTWVIRTSRYDENLTWAGDLAGAVQVSLVGFAIGGTFAGLSYFDLPYHLLSILVLLKRFVQNEVAATSDCEQDEESPAAARLDPSPA